MTRALAVRSRAKIKSKKNYIDINLGSGEFWNELNCYESSKDNLQMIDGTLAITMIHKPDSIPKLTSGSIITKSRFSLGKFEIRAAMPQGDALWAEMILRNRGTRQESLNWIRINMFNGKDWVSKGVWYINRQYERNSYRVDNKLGFHVFSIERNNTHIIWRYDNLEITPVHNLSSLHPEELDKLELVVTLGVGGDLTRTPLNFKFACPSLIVDYIRYYKWTDQELKQNDSESTNLTSAQICGKVTLPKEFQPSSSSTLIISMFVLGAVIALLIFCILGVYVTLLRRKSKVNTNEDTRVVSVLELNQDKLELNFYEDPQTYNDYNYQKPKVEHDQNYLEIES